MSSTTSRSRQTMKRSRKKNIKRICGSINNKNDSINGLEFIYYYLLIIY